MEIDTRELVDLIRGGSPPAHAVAEHQPERWQIVVCQRGFVFVGRATKEGSDLVLRGAGNVRRWGTTRGLGQLAAEGPTDKTVIDPCGTVRVHELSVVCRIDCTCDAARWHHAAT